MSFQAKTALSRETIDTVQGLIQINIDSRDGFNEAAANLQEVSLAGMFRQLAADRGEQATELRSIVTANMEEPKTDGSFMAAAHRLLLDFRAAIGGGVVAVLSEAERGEDQIKQKYEDAIKAHGDSPIGDVLRRHYVAVKASHDSIRDMRDHAKTV